MLDVLRRVAAHRSGLAGGLLVLLFVATGLLAPWLAPHDPLRGDLGRTREGPSGEHWLGTDELGRDILSRIVWGARLTLRVGLIAVIIGAAIGVPLGLGLRLLRGHGGPPGPAFGWSTSSWPSPESFWPS